MKKYLGYVLTIFMLIIPLAGTSVFAASYFIYDEYGGTWHDAEKDIPNTEDDEMCWAASAANSLLWTGWYDVGQQGDNPMETTDDIFEYFQDHWTDVGSVPQFAWDWFFTGDNDSQGWPDWSQVDVAGGGFWDPTYDFWDYYHYTGVDSNTLSASDSWMRDGYSVNLAIRGPSSHAITLWGFEYDTTPTDYTGIYITDSDNSKYGAAPRPDTLDYYDIAYNDSESKWYIDGLYGYDTYWIDDVFALGMSPMGVGGGSPVPEPGTWAIFLLGFLCGAVKMRKKFFPKN